MDKVSFRPMTEDDLPLLHRWLNNPDVAAWYWLSTGHVRIRYPRLEQVVEQYAPRIRGEEPTLPYIMLLDGEPFGYIQAYRIGSYAGYAALGVEDDDVGIDLLIGEDAHRGRGLGTVALRQFLADEVFRRPGVGCAIVAPDEQNARAIRCYKKAGFHHRRTVFVSQENEHEYVMSISRDEFEAEP